jgi:hypothetical protein
MENKKDYSKWKRKPLNMWASTQDLIISYMQKRLLNEIKHNLIAIGLIFFWSIIFTIEQLYKKEWIYFSLWLIITIMWGYSFYEKFKYYRTVKR